MSFVSIHRTNSDACDPLVGLKPTTPEGEAAEIEPDELAGETLVEVLAGDTCEPLVGIKPTPLEGETAESGKDRLAGKTVIEVLAGGTGEPLVRVDLTPSEGETAKSGEDRLQTLQTYLEISKKKGINLQL